MPLNSLERGRRGRQDTDSANQDEAKPQDDGEQEPGFKIRLIGTQPKSYLQTATTTAPVTISAPPTSTEGEGFWWKNTKLAI